MKYLFYLLLFFIFIVFPAAAMPAPVDTGSLATWKIKDINGRDGTATIEDLGNNNIRIQMYQSTQLVKSINLTGVDQIAFSP